MTNKNIANNESQKFNFHGKRILVTYPGHIEKGKLYNWLAMLDDIDMYRIWHEVGPKNGYLHTHVQLHYRKQKNIKKESHWDCSLAVSNTNPNGHPNLSFINTDVHWENVCGYNKLKDNSEPDPDEFRNFDPEKCIGNLAPTIARILKKRSWAEVVLSDDTAQFAMHHLNYAEAVFNCKKLTPFEFPHYFKDWQLFCTSLCEGPTDRYIHWFWSTEGTKYGKTVYRDWLLCQFNGHIFDNAIKTSDALNVYLTQPSGLVIFDNPRNVHQDNFNYSLYELLKCKVHCTGKYRGKRMCVDVPHVLVFANYPPSSEFLGKEVDRYKVYNLESFGAYNVKAP